MDGTYVTGTGQRITQVHAPEACDEPCPIHAPSFHHMRNWPTSWNHHGVPGTNGYMERVCEHGVGHVDPDEKFAPDIHVCDGCCSPTVALAGYEPDPSHRWPY